MSDVCEGRARVGSNISGLKVHISGIDVAGHLLPVLRKGAALFGQLGTGGEEYNAWDSGRNKETGNWVGGHCR